MTASINSQTEKVLEWQILLKFLSNEAASTKGAQNCLALVSAPTCMLAQVLQQETTEMVQILQGAAPIPSLSFPDVTTVLARAEKKGLLDSEDLRNISLLLDLSQSTKDTLRNHCLTFPAIGAQHQKLHDMEQVKQSIDHCIGIDGQLLETATPQLQYVTQRSYALRQEMRRRLEQILTSQEHEDILQGQYFAERGNRYVIPIKAERQHDIHGIVHDISSSGATVFVEPGHLVELNNSIKFADLQVKEKARRILQDLSDLVSGSVASIQENLDCLAMLDCIMAKARLSIKMHASPIHLNQECRIILNQARHPILTITRDHVVANSIRIEKETQALIISGPNAGGKTVSLKQVGLIALMVKAGLHPPCSPDSDMAFFEKVYADIGDSQDLSQNVSSFTGHILNINAILQEVRQSDNGSPKNSLILLDEVGSSTDPTEGAVLAEVLLEYFCNLGCIIVATTHYPRLKTLAFRNHQFRNASQELDPATLSPTYRLIDDTPGGSSALEIAERLGLDCSIIQAAQSLLQHQDRDLNNRLRSLHETHTKLAGEMTEAQRLRKESQRIYNEAQETRDKLRSQKQADREKFQKQWHREFSKTQRYINRMIDELKQDPTMANARSLRQTLRSLNEEIQTLLPEHDFSSDEIPHEGDLVEIHPFGTKGLLLESIEGKKQVSVRVGHQTMKTAPSALRLVSSPSVLARPSSPRNRLEKQFTHPAASQKSVNMVAPPAGGGCSQELDVRGMGMEEAVPVIMAVLDRALINHVNYLKIIHGHGTGVLKSGVRKLCKSSNSYIKSFRVGEASEGGDGVTIIELS